MYVCLSLRLLPETTKIICMLELCIFLNEKFYSIPRWRSFCQGFSHWVRNWELSRATAWLRQMEIKIEWKGKKLWRQSNNIRKRKEQHDYKSSRLSTIPCRQNLGTPQTGYWKADLDIKIDYPLFWDSNSLSDVSMTVVFNSYSWLFMVLFLCKVITAIIYIIINDWSYNSV